MKRLTAILMAFVMVAGMVEAKETIKSLKNKQKQAKANIEMTNKLLKENERTQKNTEKNIVLLKKKITEREKLIGALNQEVTLLDSNLSNLSAQRVAIEKQLEEEKKEYARLLYHNHFNKSRSQTALFVLSSESVTQALRRGRYVQQYSDYRKQQAEKVRALADSLGYKEKQLAQVKTEKQRTLAGKEIETQKLNKNREDREQLMLQLTTKEKELREQLAKQQERVEQLNKRIDKLIAEEIAAQERRAKAKAERERKAREAAAKKNNANKGKTGTSTTKSTANNVTTQKVNVPAEPKDVTQTGFEQNKGRLPMPVAGVVTEHFGIHPHPVLDHVTVNNKGIYIQAAPGSDASAIYDGEVTQIFAIPGSNNAIIVKHGNFRSVYSNLTTTYVKVGDKVKTRQKLGKIYVDTEKGNETMLYLMLYKGTVLQDPETWLK